MNINFNNNFQNVEHSSKKPELSWWLSWPAIIITLIIFWPVSIYLIWKRSTLDKKTTLFSGKTIKILGCISLFGAFVIFITSITQGFKIGDINAIIFYLLAGAGLLILGKKMKNNADKTKKYISIIINDGVVDIDNISAAIPTSYENARKDLQKMIYKGFFEGAHINESERQIVLPQNHQEFSVNYSTSTTINTTINNTNNSPKMKVVACTGCGAKNSIAAGTVGECEFCGSKIE